MELVWYPGRGYPWGCAIMAAVDSGVCLGPRKEVLAGSSHTDSLVGGVPYRCTRLVHRHQLSHRSLLLLTGTGLTGGVRYLGHWG